MRKTLALIAFGAVFSMLAAETWSGKLLDAGCYDQQKNAASCSATSKTTAFALDVSGTVYKLDRGGNAKAAAAIRNRADRSDPNQPQSMDFTAKVEGSEKSGVITVETIDVQ